MPSVHDIYCGRLLVRRKICSPEQIWRALRVLNKRVASGEVASLAEELRAANVLTERQVEKLEAATQHHRALLQEKLLASMILARGLATRDRLKDLVEEQRRENYSRGIGPMLVEAELLTAAQLAQLQGEVSIAYAQTITESEARFIEDIRGFEAPFDSEEEQKVLDTLGLTENRKRPTEGLWSREEAQAVAADPSSSRSSASSGAAPAEATRSPGTGAEDFGGRPLFESGEYQAYNPDSGDSRESAVRVAVGQESPDDPDDPDDEGDSREEPPKPAITGADEGSSQAHSPARSELRPEDCPIYGYEILAELGKGAMGVVYKCRHVFTDRITALKVLPLNLAKDGQFLERFKREAIASMRLQHENIVRAYDFGGSEEYYYLALEFIDGETLESRLQRDGLVPELETLHIARGVAAGLAFAAGVGVLHRDIKPENIMVTRAGVPKLCDFGIVKLLDLTEGSSVTLAGTTVGTPYYISPEQARGQEDLDIRSDIYSLGITLWHMLTGQLPFTGKSQGAILVRHILEEVPDPRSARPSLNAAIAELVNRMCKKKREERFQHPGELVQAIDRLLGR